MLRIEKAKKPLKVALVIPPPLRAGPIWCPNLPLGIAYLTATLEKSGHTVKVYDCPAQGIDHAKLATELASFGPRIVGITSLTPMIGSTIKAAKLTKEKIPDTTVVLGGPHATFLDQQIIAGNPQVDVVVRNEGEQTLLELAEAIACPEITDIADVAGLTFRNKEQVVCTADRPFIMNLDDLPRPAYEHFQLDRYRLFGKSILPIMSSRGCPIRCSYCVSSRMNGIGCRIRSVKNVLDEMEWLRDTHGANAYSFYDDAFTLDMDRAGKLCDEIKKRKLNLPWDCQTRVDRVSKEVLQKMKAAKCQLISFGIESGSQKILDAVKKQSTVELNAKAIEMAKDAGLTVSMSIIIGYPGETTKTLEQTMMFIRKTKPDYVYLCIATPYPGTDLYCSLKELGWKMSEDWTKYDLQTPVFINPDLPAETLLNARKKFYNEFYSPAYIMRQTLKGTFYNRIMARTALNYKLWQSKLPKLIAAAKRKK